MIVSNYRLIKKSHIQAHSYFVKEFKFKPTLGLDECTKIITLVVHFVTLILNKTT